jgi:hypothetical protein
MRRRAGGEKARRGIGRDADSFSSGQEPRRKARNPTAYLEGEARKAPHPGCPFFGLLFFGQAKKSDSAFGRRSKRPLRKRPDRGNARGDNHTHRCWIPAYAGMTAKDEATRRAPAPHPNPLPKGAREKKRAPSLSGCPQPPNRHPQPHQRPQKPNPTHRHIRTQPHHTSHRRHQQQATPHSEQQVMMGTRTLRQ